MDKEQNTMLRKPDWLKTEGFLHPSITKTRKMINKYSLKTVCQEAACPNRGECWENKSFTFILLGNLCTRTCPFCNIVAVEPEPVDHKEPERIARFISDVKLKHVVLTSVTRDDLSDGGANHFVKTLRMIRSADSNIPVELLVPDFGDFSLLEKIIDQKPDILGYNIETVERLYPAARPQYSYARGLNILAHAKKYNPDLIVKTAFMLGLGENEKEIKQTIRDIKDTNCDVLYIGQYIAPSKKHYPVSKYYHPESFGEYQEFACSIGFLKVVAGPLVRSSYRSWESFNRSSN